MYWQYKKFPDDSPKYFYVLLAFTDLIWFLLSKMHHFALEVMNGIYIKNETKPSSCLTDLTLEYLQLSLHRLFIKLNIPTMLPG